MCTFDDVPTVLGARHLSDATGPISNQSKPVPISSVTASATKPSPSQVTSAETFGKSWGKRKAEVHSWALPNESGAHPVIALAMMAGTFLKGHWIIEHSACPALAVSRAATLCPW